MKAKHFTLKLTCKEINALGSVLDEYVVDACVVTKRLLAVERVIKKILRSHIKKLEKV